MNDLTHRSTVECDYNATTVTVDGVKIVLHRDYTGGWWVGEGGEFTRYPNGPAASDCFRNRVDAAMRERLARRTWEQAFRDWLTGCELYDAGAPESKCATAGQRRGWHEQQAYREQGGWRVDDGDECNEWLGVYAPVAVDQVDLIPY